jgi:hypothetical protein
MENTPIQYPGNAESGIAKAQFLLQEITKKLNTDHPGFTTTATQGQRNMSKFGDIIDIITKTIKKKIMEFLGVTGEWNSIYYDEISTAIPTYGVLNSIIEELEKNQTIKDIIIEAKEKYDPEVLVTHVTPASDQNAGRKMRKSNKRHRKSNKKHRKSNKKHKRSIKKHRK